MTWNRWKNPIKALVVVAIVALCAWAVLPIQQTIHLGLDLQGGMSVLLQLEPTPEVPKITKQVQNQVQTVIQNRINGLGVSEPVLQEVGSNRLLVQLPGIKNPDEALRTLKEAAILEFKICPAAAVAKAESDKAYADSPTGAYKDCGKTVYSGAELKGAQPAPEQLGSGWRILFQTKNPAKFGKLTQENMGKPLGIFLDHKYISAPTINGVITADGEITGSFTQEDVTRISNELNAGALPVPTRIIENETVGPTLGKVDLVKSLYAAIVGLSLVVVFMIMVYRVPGLLADLALAIYVLMMLAVLAISHAVLTLPGIAGFVLSIGMAVDANVLIFERLKEEIWAGKTLRGAVRTGFARAYSSVFDSHVTTIVGAAVLFLLGTGTVKGFAYTLFWGTVLSLVTAVFITRFFTDLVVDNDVVTSHKAYGA
ncbi:MAG TPA: protein translocase subunit SecD [Candidatus Dormibacteraeota bacterium]|nr:protein translocase subunit SecD [Candidatus Dormibacteraeota bacterium]